MVTGASCRRMRLSPFALIAPLLLLAGCTTPNDAVDAASTDVAGAVADFVAWHSEGQFFVRPSQGSEPSEVEVPFLVNATERATRAVVTIGERYGPVELPRSTAFLEAQLVDPDGQTIVSKRRMPAGEPTLTLETKELPVGESRLVLLIGGGSDERADGDSVKWTVGVC